MRCSNVCQFLKRFYLPNQFLCDCACVHVCVDVCVRLLFNTSNNFLTTHGVTWEVKHFLFLKTVNLTPEESASMKLIAMMEHAFQKALIVMQMTGVYLEKVL